MILHLSIAAGACLWSLVAQQAWAAYGYFEYAGFASWGNRLAWDPNLTGAFQASGYQLLLPGGYYTPVPNFYQDQLSTLNVDDAGGTIVGSQTLGWSFDVSSVSLNSATFAQLHADSSPRWIVLESSGTALELGSSAVLSFQLGGLSSSQTYLYFTSAPTSLTSGPSIDVEGTTSGTQRTLTIAAEIWGYGFLKTGTGTLALTMTSNEYSGPTILNAGTLAISADGALGDTSGTLYLNGGTLRADASFSLSSSRSLDLANDREVKGDAASF